MAPGPPVPHDAPGGADGTRAWPLNLPHKTCPIGQAGGLTEKFAQCIDAARVDLGKGQFGSGAAAFSSATRMLCQAFDAIPPARRLQTTSGAWPSPVVAATNRSTGGHGDPSVFGEGPIAAIALDPSKVAFCARRLSVLDSELICNTRPRAAESTS